MHLQMFSVNCPTGQIQSINCIVCGMSPPCIKLNRPGVAGDVLQTPLFKRPGVAGAALQAPLSLIN